VKGFLRVTIPTVLLTLAIACAITLWGNRHASDAGAVAQSWEAVATWVAAAGAVGALLYLGEQVKLQRAELAEQREELTAVREEQADQRRQLEREQAAKLSAWFERLPPTTSGTTATLTWRAHVLNGSNAILTQMRLVVLGKRGAQPRRSSGVGALEPGVPFTDEISTNLDITKSGQPPQWQKSYGTGSMDPHFVVLFYDNDGRAWAKLLHGPLKRIEPWHYRQDFQTAENALEE